MLLNVFCLDFFKSYFNGIPALFDIIDCFVVFRNYLNDLTYAKEFEYALVERTWALVPFIVLSIELHA